MFNHITIKSFLITIASILFIGSAIFSTLLWSAFNRIETAIIKQENQAHAVFEIKEITYHIVQIQQFLTDVGATHNQAGFEEAKTQKEQALNKLASLEKLAPELSDTLGNLSTHILTLHQTGEAMAWAYINDGIEAGNAMMTAPNTGLDDASSRLSEQLKTLSDQVDNKFGEAIKDLNISISSSRNTMISFSIVLTIFVVIVFVLIYIKVEPPLASLKKSLDEMNTGGGDLTQRIPSNSTDEIGQTIVRFNDFLSLIHGLMRQVTKGTDDLTSSANRLQDMAEKAKQDMLKQQLGTDQVATTVTELTATVQEVALNTNNASSTAMESNTEAENGKRIVAKVIKSIHILSSDIDAASTVIAKVETDCKNVSSVLDVIQGIADQTNLLALNAAIEAARAGEQGRGFAVVADEVRTLASRTQDSTKEIQSMIEQLQIGSREAVNAMTDSRDQTKKTVTIIEEAGSALDKISSMVANITDMNSHISSAVNEQKFVVEHINENIVSISEITMSATLDSEKTVKEAENLQHISDTLQQATAQFKV